MVELRSGGADSRTIGGYAALFGERSELLGNGFREIVTREFFNKSRGDGYPGVVARFEHDPLMVLGSADAGTLRLNVDRRGLDYEVDLPKTRDDVLELVSRKDIRSSSFAFQSFSDDWGFDDGVAVRTLLSGRLIDVAPVSSPAYTKSSVSLRSLSRFMNCPYADVESLAAQGELRRLFTRSDRSLTGAQMRSQIIKLRYPTPQETGKQKLVNIEGRRWIKPTPTPAQRLVEIEGKRWGAM
ncbi:MAG: HK97 family phage prohead protease [Mycobacterium sp.]|uniref:HK97 family phage prohead protease n=1 Tax=Mycobacterium sp. TaxID=1785 RepID=UPI003F996B13